MTTTSFSVVTARVNGNNTNKMADLFALDSKMEGIVELGSVHQLNMTPRQQTKTQRGRMQGEEECRGGKKGCKIKLKKPQP